MPCAANEYPQARLVGFLDGRRAVEQTAGATTYYVGLQRLRMSAILLPDQPPVMLPSQPASPTSKLLQGKQKG